MKLQLWDIYSVNVHTSRISPIGARSCIHILSYADETQHMTTINNGEMIDNDTPVWS